MTRVTQEILRAASAMARDALMRSTSLDEVLEIITLTSLLC